MTAVKERWRRIVTGVVGTGLAVTGLVLASSIRVEAQEAQEAQEVEKVEAAKTKPPETWHATAYVRGRMGIRVIDYWSKGPNMRARTLIAGHPITTIVRGDRYVVVDGLTGSGLAIRRSKIAMGDDATRIRPFAFEFDEMIRDGGEKIEDVKIGVMDGEIWRVSDSQARRKLWVTTGDPRVPLRIETFNRSPAETINLDYSDWTFNLRLDDGFFETPANFEIETFEYDAYVEKTLDGPVGAIPILYPDLLHGNRPR